MTSKSKFDIISSDGEHIIVKETPVHLTDEKIKSVLFRAYEYAQKDVNTKSLLDYYDCCFSVSLTLFLTLLTASFNGVFGIEANTVTLIVKIVFGSLMILGILMLVLKLNTKRQSDTKQRDIAVEEVFSRYIKCCPNQPHWSDSLEKPTNNPEFKTEN